MKTICLGLEQGSYPVCELDENGYIGDDVSLEELGLGNHLCKKIKKLQNMYDSLFINNDKEFSYLGKDKLEEVKSIRESYEDIANEFQSKLKNKYNIQILDLDI